MTHNHFDEDEPCFVISVVAKMVSLHPQTLRYYDKIRLLRPSRTEGRTRLYSPSDVERLRKIKRLSVDLGVNLAGVEVIMNMSDRISELQEELERVQQEAERRIGALRRRIQEAEQRETRRKEELGIIEIIPPDTDPNSPRAESPEGEQEES